jgi:hypothetical protein
MQKMPARQRFYRSGDNSLTVLLGTLITTAGERRDGVSRVLAQCRRILKGRVLMPSEAISPPWILCKKAICGSVFWFRSNDMKQHLFAVAALSGPTGGG